MEEDWPPYGTAEMVKRVVARQETWEFAMSLPVVDASLSFDTRQVASFASSRQTTYMMENYVPGAISQQGFRAKPKHRHLIRLVPFMSEVDPIFENEVISSSTMLFSVPLLSRYFPERPASMWMAQDPKQQQNFEPTMKDFWEVG